jgi:hypothetical protein
MSWSIARVTGTATGVEDNAPGVTRTPGQRFRKPLLYPPELRGRRCDTTTYLTDLLHFHRKLCRYFAVRVRSFVVATEATHHAALAVVGVRDVVTVGGGLLCVR